MPLFARIIAAIYFVMSAITFIAFFIDKRQAQAGGWRISEKRLHRLEILGGWPGSLLGQQLFRHKTRKRGYQMRFWLIVALHFAVWTAIYLWLR